MNNKYFVLSLFLLSSFAFGQNCISLTHLKSKAKKEGKDILLYFSGSDWCKPCILLNDNVLKSDVFLSFAEDKFIIENYDFPQNLNQISKEEIACREEMAELYNQDGIFPKLILINSNGSIIREINGYKNQSATEILSFLNMN